MVPRVWIGIRRALLVSRVVVACSRCLFFLELATRQSFSVQFSLKLCMFRSCESLWQVCPTCCTLGVHSFDIFNSLCSPQCLPTPTLRVAFFCCHKIVKYFFAVLSLRDLSVIWRRHGRFSGAPLRLQALSTSRPRYYKLLLQIDDRSNPELCFEREHLLCELVHWMVSAKISARGVASFSIPEILFLTCVCPHTHGPPQAGPEGAWRWRDLLIPVLSLSCAGVLVLPCRLPGACTRLPYHRAIMD